jgi:D-arabinan endo alpha-(1,5)-arabinofuranosidase
MARALRTEGETVVAHRTRMGAAFATLSAATLAVTVSAAAQGSAQTSVGQANPVALITGAKSINATEERYEIKGTDLGIMWTDERGRILAAFGDTFGAKWTGVDSGFARPAVIDWRSNTLARSSDRNPADGMSFDDYVTDRPGHAKELVPSLKREGVETTKIPTGGINIDGRNYLAYMSIRKFTEPGQWITNYSGVAYSDDGGQNWTDAPSARRPNSAGLDNTFQMIAYARRDGYVYAFGTPNGRFGAAHVARVAEDQLLDNAAYEYWTGKGWEHGSSTIATPIVAEPVGELSVRFDKTLNSWEMMYLDESRKAIVLRLAPQPTGPWSAEIPVATATEYPDLYGGFLNPDSNGTDLYFTMTQYKTYNVMMMHATLPASVVRAAKH